MIPRLRPGPARPPRPRPGAPVGVRLDVVAESDVLRPTTDAAGPLEPPPSPGVLQRAVETGFWEAGDPALFSAAAGACMPDWAQSVGTGVRYPVDLARVRDACWTPAYGAVLDHAGRVYKSPVAGALYLTPTLDHLPAVTARAGVARFQPTGEEPRRASASVFLPWGARYNYGHFVLDALPGLALFAERGLLDRFPALAPPLTPWQRDLIGLMLRPGETVEEVEAPLVEVGDLLFCSCMDHFLHAPNTPLDRVRARILEASPAEAGSRRLYLTRRAQTKRVMVNEAELEAALQARGYQVIEPERLSVAQQIALFRSADVVVSATGAALANVLFMKPGALVFEIQPSNYIGTWLRALTQFVQARWHGFFCPSPLEETAMYLEGELRPGLSFSWAPPLDDFLAFLDAHAPSEATANA